MNYLQKKIIFYRDLGIKKYLNVMHAMNHFTTSRKFDTFDEIWFVEHRPVFTQGQKIRKENLFFINHIPIINSDRGGQMTYHGPGQQILYFLIDLNKRKINIRMLIDILENTIIMTLKQYSIVSHIKKKSPGVYINNKKKFVL